MAVWVIHILLKRQVHLIREPTYPALRLFTPIDRTLTHAIATE